MQNTNDLTRYVKGWTRGRVEMEFVASSTSKPAYTKRATSHVTVIVVGAENSGGALSE